MSDDHVAPEALTDLDQDDQFALQDRLYDENIMRGTPKGSMTEEVVLEDEQ